MNAIEGGHTDPRASRIVAIAQVLGVSTDTLLLGMPTTVKRAPTPTIFTRCPARRSGRPMVVPSATTSSFSLSPDCPPPGNFERIELIASF